MCLCEVCALYGTTGGTYSECVFRPVMYLKDAEMKIAVFAHFKEYHRNHKILRIYMVFGDAVSKLQTFVWIAKHISRFITSSLCSS